MTEAEHVQRVRERAQQLIEALNQAADAGVSQATLLPELVAVFQEAGMMP
jgi:hypothetical protein